MTEDEPIRLLDDLRAEFRRAAAAVERRKAPRGIGRLRTPMAWPQAGGRLLATVTVAVVALGGVAYAVPATRSAVSDIGSSFSAWVGGDNSEAPGRALQPADNAPPWLNADDGRVIAENEGVKLIVQRVETERYGTMLSFSMGAPGDKRAPIDGTLDGWRERFATDPIAILGTMAFTDGRFVDDAGRVPLGGVTAAAVDRVELRYATGPPLIIDNVDGGVVLLADAWRGPREVAAFDDKGTTLGHVDISHIDIRHICERVPTCADRLAGSVR